MVILTFKGGFMFLSLVFLVGLIGSEPTNVICPVEPWVKVTEKTRRIVQVKRASYRVCCSGCVKKLSTNPDKYLNEDGSIKPATKPVKQKKSTECFTCKS